MKNLALFILISLCVQALNAQNKLPIIKAGSKNVAIRDGKSFSKTAWNIDPKVKPDTYYTNIPQKNNRVTFITDLDSISFDTRYGQVYDFIILLNGKDSCYTRIAANYNEVITPTRLRSIPGPDTIPFKLIGSRIYFAGTLNGQPIAAIQFDLGAGGSIISKTPVSKLSIKFDGSTLLNNTHGVNQAPTSSNNTLTIGSLKWHNVKFVQADNLQDYEDAVIGNSFFGNKIIEIDYDKNIFIVHNTLPQISKGYSSHDVIFEQHRPKINATITVDGKKYTDRFLFDTGRDGTMLIGDDFVAKYNLWDKFKTIFPLGNKKIVRVPEVVVGTLIFKDIVTNAANPAKPGGRQTLLGNELLNHFNVILDNQQGMIYLKLNGLQNNAYSDWATFKLTALIIIAIFIIVLSLIAVLVKKILNRKKHIAD